VIRATYGAIVEGLYDVGVFEELIPRVCPYPADVSVREAGGRNKLMSRFPQLIRMFEHCTITGGAVDRVLVIRDSNGKPSEVVEADMRSRIGPRTYAFQGLEVHAVRQETEAWLLADPTAISRVAHRTAQTVAGPLENRPHAKEDLMDVLSDVHLQYTPETCRQIAREIDLQVLRAACPSFLLFEQKVQVPPQLPGL